MSLLPLTAFEKYMVQDSHPGYEMTILMEYAFRGKINRDLLVDAYKRVTKYEPLFRSVLVKKNGLCSRCSDVNAKNVSHDLSFPFLYTHCLLIYKITKK